MSLQLTAISFQLTAVSFQLSARGIEGIMKDFRQLKVWQTAHSLTLEVYSATRGFPREEVYGLTSQMRRSSASIAANLAQGCGRNGDAELGRFCSIAMGSASELEYHLLQPADYEALNAQTIEVKRLLGGLMRNLKAVC